MCLPYFRYRQDRCHPGQGQDLQIQRRLLDLRKVPHFRSIRYRKSCQRQHPQDFRPLHPGFQKV